MAKTVNLPGLIDVHTHLRVPGGEHKEDFATGTAAALAGGFTFILAMPNTTPPLVTPQLLKETRHIAQQTIHCDIGLFAGAAPRYLDQLIPMSHLAPALKIYLNETFGPLRVEDLSTLMTCFQTWPHSKPISMHAEGLSVAVGICLAATYGRSVHFCHISRKSEIELIAAAKRQGLPITCEVTPHHLFLTETDTQSLGSLGDMRPTLAQWTDQEALWQHINSTIDCIATDHAPHSLDEKKSITPPPGVPGLETSLPLMLTAVKQNRLTMDRLVELMVTNPRRIFNLPEQPNTYVQVDTEAKYTISDDMLFTKCSWTPFGGMEMYGQIQRVILRGELVYDASRSGDKWQKIVASPGSGQIFP